MLDLQQFETRPPPVNASDVARRELALKRAKALAMTLPDGWPPGPPVVWTPGLDSYGSYNRRRKDIDEGDGDEPAPRNKPGRKPLFGTTMSRAEVIRRHRAKAKARALHPDQPACDFPLTLAACIAREKIQFNIGDALIEECRPPPEQGRGPDGSYKKLEACRSCLLNAGVEYSAGTLRKLRNIAFIFPPAFRRPGASFCMHQVAGSPAVLDACIKALPAGEKLSVDFLHDYIAGRPDLARSPKHRAPAPKPEIPPAATADIAGMTAGLVAALKILTKTMRVACLAGMMRALGLTIDDFAPACQLAARRLAVPSPAPAVGRIAAVA